MYPEIEPYWTGHLDVGDGHSLYVEQLGRPDGVPVVCLHGGPGMGALGAVPRYFDPDHYRIIQFDQRGALRATPLGALDANTTWHLVDDIEVLRRALGIERWIVFGGSWGSALGIAYAGTHPDAVAGLILRGIFLGRRAEDQWQYQHGASALYPRAWAEFLAPIPAAQHSDLIGAYYRWLTEGSEAEALAAARAFLIWGLQTNQKVPDGAARAQILDDATAPFVIAMARIAAHYAHHGNFLRHDTQLLDLAALCASKPAHIIHGTDDHACPVQSAWDLARLWPQAGVSLVEGAGHAPVEPDHQDAIVAAADAARDWDVS